MQVRLCRPDVNFMKLRLGGLGVSPIKDYMRFGDDLHTRIILDIERIQNHSLCVCQGTPRDQSRLESSCTQKTEM